MADNFVNTPVIHLFVKTAKYMDDEGLFNQADGFDSAFIKLSQTPLPLPNGQLPFPMSKGEPQMSDAVKKTVLKQKPVAVNIEKYRADINGVLSKLKKYPDTISVIKDPYAHGYNVTNPSSKAQWETDKQKFLSFAGANKAYTSEQITKDVYNAIAFEIYSLSNGKVRVQKLPGPTPNSWATVSTNPKIQFLGDMGTSSEIIYIQKIINIARAILNDTDMIKLCEPLSSGTTTNSLQPSNDKSPEVTQQSMPGKTTNTKTTQSPVTQVNTKPTVPQSDNNINYDKISSYMITEEIFKYLKQQGPVYDFLKNSVNFQLANQIWRACARFHAVDISKADAVSGVEQRIYSSICESIPNTVRSVCANFLKPLVTSFAQRTVYTKTDQPLVIYYKNARALEGNYDQRAKVQIAVNQEEFVMLLINILSHITAYDNQQLLIGMINFNKNSGLYQK